MNKKLLAAITAIGIIAASAAPAMASQMAGNETVTDTYDPNRNGTLIIDYQDDADNKNDPVSGAEFTIYKIAYPKMTASKSEVTEKYEPVLTNGNVAVVNSEIDAEAIAEDVIAAYENKEVKNGFKETTATEDSGRAYADLTPGIYLAVETKAADRHIASSPFVFSMPKAAEENGIVNGWDYLVTAEPKPNLCGELRIKKTVKGGAGETNKKFHFKVVIGDKKNSDEYHYQKSNGKEGTIKNGGQISLKSGEDVVIDTIPSGLSYKVTEVEANQDGYKTTSKNSDGHIKGKKTVTASFVNSKGMSGDGEGNGGKPGVGSGGGGLSDVKTGDNVRLVLWLVVLALVLSGTIGIILNKKKSRKI